MDCNLTIYYIYPNVRWIFYL